MGSRHYSGRPRRPTESAVEARQVEANCPHAEFRRRYGWPTCRVCGAEAGSVGVGCAYSAVVDRSPAADGQGLGGVAEEKQNVQAVSAGGMAR